MKKRILLWLKGLSGVYLLILFWAIVFKFWIPGDIWLVNPQQSLNLLPFFEIMTNRIVRRDLVLNVLIFIPFWFLLTSAFPNRSWKKKVGIVFFVSVIFESLQYCFALGSTDITDLISNTLGGMLGVWAYFLLSRTLSSQENAERITLILWTLMILWSLLFVSIMLILN